MTTNISPPAGRIMLKNVRLAYAPDMWTPKAPDENPTGPAKFKITVILPVDHPQVEDIKKAMRTVAREKWKDKAEQMFAAASARDKLPLHDGSLRANSAGFAGNLFFVALSKDAPGSVPTYLGGPEGKTVLSSADASRLFYGGCYVNTSVDIYCYDKPTIGLTAQFRGVQFLRDGDAFGAGSPASTAEFGAVEGSTETADWA